MSGEGIVLVVRRTIRASAERLFDAWTEPRHLQAWWGPRPVTCSGAEVDLRVGGRYRIDNAMPDGSTLTIEGVFREIRRPHKLVYTWQTAAPGARGEGESSIVTVRFEPVPGREGGDEDEETEVIIVHEKVPDATARDSHEDGWTGCLDELEAYVVRARGGRT
ncbi:MAG TPA: SRPBCC family protein [Polyangiaceae bacterium]|jgi:uncharacterized protein YndB with AHSA1/START domain|nr:SRPBCC family protein [Polyangiaceae bacterium]